MGKLPSDDSPVTLDDKDDLSSPFGARGGSVFRSPYTIRVEYADASNLTSAVPTSTHTVDPALPCVLVAA